MNKIIAVTPVDIPSFKNLSMKAIFQHLEPADLDSKLAFCNLAGIVEKTFNIMGLTKYCEIYDSIDSGVEKLS